MFCGCRAVPRPLDPAQALENGVQIVIELSLLAVGVGVVFIDHWWQAHKKAMESCLGTSHNLPEARVWIDEQAE